MTFYFKCFFIAYILFLFILKSNAQSWWCGDPSSCSGTYYCDVGPITPTAATQTITNSSFCAVAGGTGHSNNFNAGSALWVRTSFVATASTTYCFGLIVTGSAYRTQTEIDILGTSCGGAGNMIATITGGTLPGGNEVDNCLTWTSGATDGGKTFYIQYSDGPGSCYTFGSNTPSGNGTEIATVYPTYRKGNCNCVSGKINALPVELIDFTASYCLNCSHIKLYWQTATERNNDYFEVERSTDGKSWSEIGKVKGAGNSSTTLNYDFTDTELPYVTETIYYRLKQTDFNGQFEYFGPVAVKLFSEDSWMLIVKNPADDELKGTLITTESSSVALDIIDIQGRIVSREKINAVHGSNLVQMDISDLQKGVYFIKAYSRDKNILSKFVKM